MNADVYLGLLCVDGAGWLESFKERQREGRQVGRKSGFSLPVLDRNGKEEKKEGRVQHN